MPNIYDFIKKECSYCPHLSFYKDMGGDTPICTNGLFANVGEAHNACKKDNVCSFSLNKQNTTSTFKQIAEEIGKAAELITTAANLASKLARVEAKTRYAVKTRWKTTKVKLPQTYLKIPTSMLTANIPADDKFKALEEEIKASIKKCFEQEIKQLFIKWGFKGNIDNLEELKKFAFDNSIYIEADPRSYGYFVINYKLKEKVLITINAGGTN